MESSAFVQSFLAPQKMGNWFRDFNPLSKANTCFAIAFTAIVVSDWRYGFPLCVFYGLFAVAAGRFRPFFKLFWKLLLLTLGFLVLIRQMSFNGFLVLFTPWLWTWDAFEAAFNISSYILGFSGAILLFFNTTEMRDLMYSLEQKGVSHATSYIMLASFQTIIDLRQNAVTIMESQKSRGIETDGKFLDRIKAFFPILAPLFLGALASTEEKSIAMDARAFSVERSHTFLRELRPVPPSEKVLVIACDLYLVAVIGIKIYMTFFANR